jgi:hypothetical protein
MSPSLTLTLVAKSTGVWSELARRTTSPFSYTLRRLGRRSVLELRLVKLIITTVLGLLLVFVFVLVLVYVTLESVGVRTRGGPKPTSKCCVSLSWMVMQGEHTGVYPSSGKRRPYIQRGEMFVFPCTEVLV